MCVYVCIYALIMFIFSTHCIYMLKAFFFSFTCAYKNTHKIIISFELCVDKEETNNKRHIDV
jgi:hypothetical protein